MILTATPARELGLSHVHPLGPAVLAGFFELGKLLDPQENYGIAVLWEQDLRPLEEFVVGTG